MIRTKAETTDGGGTEWGDPRAAAQERKRTVRALRFLLLLAAMGAAHPAAEQGGVPWQFWLASGLFFLSNVAYHFERTDVFVRLRLSAILFLFDIAILGALLALLGERSNGFFALAALTVLLSAVTRSVSGVVVSTVAAGALYAVLALLGRAGTPFLSAAFCTRLAMLFALAIFVGHLARETERARGAARLNAGLYRGLFEMSPAWTFLCDRRGRILHLNRAAERDLGYTTQRLAGMPLDEVASLPPEWRRIDACPDAPPRAETLPMRILRADGVRLSAQALVAVVPAGEETYLLLQAHERATELTRLRRAVTRAERRVSLGRLACVVVHEINNLLTSVLGYAQLAACRDGLEEGLRGELGQIERGALVAARIIRNLVVFTRRGDVEREPFAFNPVVASVLELKVFELSRANIRLDWVPDPTLPDAVGDVQATALVVLHLVDRAQSAIEQAGRKEGRIVVHTVRTGEGVAFEISDNGAVLPPVVREHLLEGEAAEPVGVPGPDLYVCRSILRGQGGDLTVEGEAERGTVIRAALPAAKPAAEGGPVRSVPPTIQEDAA